MTGGLEILLAFLLPKGHSERPPSELRSLYEELARVQVFRITRERAGAFQALLSP